MNGLLMYLVDSADMFYVSLSMQDGALYLYAHPDNELMTQAALPYHMDFIILFFSVCMSVCLFLCVGVSLCFLSISHFPYLSLSVSPCLCPVRFLYISVSLSFSRPLPLNISV